MGLVVFAASSGSPGTTSLALALAASWPRRALLVEADPDGGRLAARCGLSVRPGLVDLAAVARSGRVATADLSRVCQRSPEGVDVVVAHTAAEQVTAILGSSATRLGDALRHLDDLDVLVDIGRLRPDSVATPLVVASHQTVVVSGTRLEDIASMVHRRPFLDELAPAVAVGVVVTASGEHAAVDAARAMHLPLLGVRPGRSGRRTGERGRRRESDWITRLATDIAGLVAERSTQPASLAMPSGPPLPGPAPLVDMT